MKAGASFFFFLRIQLCNFEGRGQFCSSVIIKNTRLYAKIKFPFLMPTVRIRSWLQPENKMTALVPDSLAVSRDISVQISSVALVVWIKPATISS